MDYCSYVHRYSLKQYSPLIQKVINYVNLHLDLPLSLKRLSEMYFISPSYLSALFRQETGTTLTDYINTQRVHRAAQQLVSTNDSVSAIASGVGMLDVNYFSKIFKKALGVTPTQYRRNTKKQS
jgi:YesN/AraC family two-component response regulator